MARIYSADEQEVAWNGLDMMEGAAAENFLNESASGPEHTKKVGARGQLYIAYNTDKSGTIEWVVDQSSQLHQDLLFICEANKDPAQRRSNVANFVHSDLSVGSKNTWVNAFIETRADQVRGIEGQTFTWVFGFERYQYEPAQPAGNVVPA